MLRDFALVAAAAATFVCGTPAMADNGCSDVGSAVALESVLTDKAGVSHVWGLENIKFLKGEVGVRGQVLRVAYPQGSFSPGSTGVRGGAGFELSVTPGARSACLSYKVRFPAGFDFVKGGKLPGLFGGANPRGCVEPGSAEGFSTRLMWRSGGVGELYLYAPGRETRCGRSIGRGGWSFVPGAWTAITQRVIASTAGAQDGSVEIWVNGKSVIKAEGIALGPVNGLFFSTFFGGADKSWATPRHQTVDFADFVIGGSARDPMRTGARSPR